LQIFLDLFAAASADLVQNFAAALVGASSPASEVGSPVTLDEAVAALEKIFVAALKAAAPAPEAPLASKKKS
jgi:hypothetical protein